MTTHPPSDSSTSSHPLLIDSHNPNDYINRSILSSSKSRTTYKACYANSNTRLRIEVFHDYMGLEDLYDLTQLIFLTKRCINHTNILGVHCTFKHGDELWVVMPFFDMECLSSRMNSSFPRGWSEANTAFVLTEILKAIERVHEHGHVHGKIDLDHVLVNKGKKIRDVKLDFGLLSYNNEEPNYGHRPIGVAAPDPRSSEKVDIWMFGLLAMELFFGKIPASNIEELTWLVLRIKDLAKSSKPKKNSSLIVKLVGGCFGHVCSSDCGGKMPSRLLGEVMALCLDPTPLNRPTARELLNHQFFSTA